MKKLKLMGAFVMLLSGLVNAQPITGLGDIKIGMTVEEFLGSEELKNKNVRDISTQSHNDRMEELLKKSNNTIWKKDSESKVDSYLKIYLTGVIEYEFKIPLGVKSYSGDLHEVKAKFYDGKLISIRVPNAGTEFEELLTTKYGKPLKMDRTKTVICQNGYGAKSEHLNGSMASVWGEGKPIRAQVHWSFYDCGKGGSAYYIEDVKKVGTVEALERKAEQNQKNSETYNKASASKL